MGYNIKIEDVVKGVYIRNPSCRNLLKSVTFRDMVSHILPLCDGDILEIGAYVGDSTLIFLEETKKMNRNVYVVDPWDGHQQGDEKVYQKFIQNVKGFDNLNVLRKSSQDPLSIEYISKLSLSFCLVDGLHTQEAATSDIIAVQKSNFKKGVIIVDDVRDLYGSLGKQKCQEIMNVVDKLQLNGWKHILSPDDWLCSCLVKED